MLHRLTDDLRAAAGVAARRIFLIAAAAGSLFITTAFVCAAAFVFVLERYGVVQACLTGAAIFLVVALISAASYLTLKRSEPKQVASKAKPTGQSFVPDPMMLAAGLQVARAIGFKKLIPILAVAGLALGIMAARSQTGESDDGPEEGS